MFIQLADFQMQQQVYILLKEPVNDKAEVEVLLEGKNKVKHSVQKLCTRNPYTVDFRMPGK